MLTSLDPALLAEAFPAELRADALVAGAETASLLDPRQWTERFAVKIANETVLIPARLNFVSEEGDLQPGSTKWQMARALQTRDNDGFARQRAVRDVLANVEPWAAPFVVALIGDYVVEILSEIDAALTPELTNLLAAFIRENPEYWAITKQRVGSYWDAYYRSPRNRSTYVGFRLIEKLEAASPAT